MILVTVLLLFLFHGSFYPFSMVLASSPNVPPFSNRWIKRLRFSAEHLEKKRGVSIVSHFIRVAL